ncbi:hypothetical protein ACFL3E_02310 [Patescibacteria group bacterium]
MDNNSNLEVTVKIDDQEWKFQRPLGQLTRLLGNAIRAEKNPAQALLQLAQLANMTENEMQKYIYEFKQITGPQ